MPLYTEQHLPPIMGVYSYIDCAEGDLKKLREAAATIGSGEPSRAAPSNHGLALGGPPPDLTSFRS